MKAGATVDCKNANGATPLMNTAITNNPEATKVLLEYGADRSLKNAEGKTALDIAKGSSKAVAALLEADGKGEAEAEAGTAVVDAAPAEVAAIEPAAASTPDDDWGDFAGAEEGREAHPHDPENP